jgi:hypothetical protein
VHLHVAWRPLEQAIAAVCFLAGLGFGSAEAVSTGWPDATAGSYLLITASAVVHSTGRVQRRGLAWASGTGAVASPVAVDGSPTRLLDRFDAPRTQALWARIG